MMIPSAARARIGSAALLCCLIASGSAQAQTPAPPEPIESMPIHAGPFGLRPSLALTNVGTDSNVFNVADDPQDDFTATIVPRIVARVRAGRLFFSYGAASDLVYYQTYKDEGSVNGTTGRYEFTAVRSNLGAFSSATTALSGPIIMNAVPRSNANGLTVPAFFAVKPQFFENGTSTISVTFTVTAP